VPEHAPAALTSSEMPALPVAVVMSDVAVDEPPEPTPKQELLLPDGAETTSESAGNVAANNQPR